MRDFSWTYFTMTGDVESFLLYKEVDQVREAGSAEAAAAAEAAAQEPAEAWVTLTV
ncbi:YqzL family protein [Paenibacillus albicereus]|uniref:YqzL family protein n=1 Tax=Paenibacillus albicereus TaxID=2726185 RepID=A0A6H2GZE3_9BACL|nr:YqzL family protein [Paenibacillus albicereus]QJC52546.1 YqzL family protein [Paenibacillus albicereus]